MDAASNNLWTIEELSAQVALALSVDYGGQGNGQVREVPDPRTIRYYTTLGLVARPASMRGRTALYGRRHLLQLVAVKRLQAQGDTLAQLQQRLLGLTDAELAKIARLPAVDSPQEVPGPRSRSFWTQRPGPVDPPQLGAAPQNNDATTLPPMHGIRLGADVTLLLAPARPLEDNDLEAIRTVAGPLLKLLEKRRLLANRQREFPGREADTSPGS
jgi:DNA-binding transcriptional MerR regulator